ncbi:MAG: translation elongation factor Ts [Armatimonadetes bacterium]|nr:translation elongation factor Ts [Armatimonadota bacterium]
MEITAQMVSHLREQTGVGMMECKKALVECNGDAQKALDLLRVRGKAGAEKRAGRAASEGVVAVASSGTRAALVELCCETDFVARNEEFRQAAQTLADVAASSGVETVNGLLGGRTAEGVAVQSLVDGLVSRLRENIVVRRCVVLSAGAGEMLSTYSHKVTNKIGVIVAAKGDATNPAHDEAGRNAAMHVAASKPQYLKREDVPTDVVEHEKQVLAEKTRVEGKPEAAIPKIVEGRIGKFFEQVCLVDQPYVRDPSKTVGQMLRESGVEPIAFSLYVVGQD